MTKTLEPSNLLTFQPSFYPSNLPAFSPSNLPTLQPFPKVSRNRRNYKTTKLHNYKRLIGEKIDTGEMAESVQKWEKTVSPIYRHFPYSRYFVVSPGRLEGWKDRKKVGR